MSACLLGLHLVTQGGCIEVVGLLVTLFFLLSADAFRLGKEREEGSQEIKGAIVDTESMTRQTLCYM